MITVLASIIGYLIGCLHGSQLVSMYKRVDIKNAGVKNAGASNTTILLGWKYGIFVALFDILKSTFAILIVLYLLKMYGISGDEQILLIYITALFVILGHNYPITMKFSGGKGTASLVGILLAVDWKIAVIGIGLLLVITITTDYLVIGVLVMYLSFLLSTYVFFGLEPTLIVIFLSILSIAKHMENYHRIITKQETKLSSMFRKN
ncbi:glycerol-3-phosphate acyltransferase [Virgibacillus pantothenticus]|uniref:glycerol-3-phosphate acyltransferase n=1 Tax=Virgibacillus pantothenticus TaxID=1473 RepID=UPI001B119F46|nr:glycerol-3-phosphate acyltransferase [Virgibacillus pantothenticus]GIP62996.1 glycerol-3-phosphate acyltransferase [Virgibacillus pantothenticus]